MTFAPDTSSVILFALSPSLLTYFSLLLQNLKLVSAATSSAMAFLRRGNDVLSTNPPIGVDIAFYVHGSD
jgi:hypothetical protein